MTQGVFVMSISNGFKNLLAYELMEVQETRELVRNRRRNRSRLDKYRAEIIDLRYLDASYKDIAIWLRKHKRIKVNATTVWRMVRKWEDE